MKSPHLLNPLLLAAFLSACSRNHRVPSEADVRAAVEQQIQASSQGCIKLLQFHKTSDLEGGNVLLVKASAELEFLEDCHWLTNTDVIVLKTTKGETPNVRKGEHRTANLSLQFRKTDRGWEITK